MRNAPSLTARGPWSSISSLDRIEDRRQVDDGAETLLRLNKTLRVPVCGRLRVVQRDQVRRYAELTVECFKGERDRCSGCNDEPALRPAAGVPQQFLQIVNRDDGTAEPGDTQQHR